MVGKYRLWNEMSKVTIIKMATFIRFREFTVIANQNIASSLHNLNKSFVTIKIFTKNQKEGESSKIEHINLHILWVRTSVCFNFLDTYYFKIYILLIDNREVAFNNRFCVQQKTKKEFLNWSTLKNFPNFKPSII